MLIVCPNCAARYEVAALALPAQGREVECTACGHVWLHLPPPDARRAASAVPDPDSGMRVRAFVRMAEQQEKNPSLLQMKVFCSKVLLPYMIPDTFEFLPALPKTSTDKIDYQKLTSLN